MSQPTHCLRCERDGAATRLCPLHAQAEAMREALEAICRDAAFEEAKPTRGKRSNFNVSGYAIGMARAILKEIEP